MKKGKVLKVREKVVRLQHLHHLLAFKRRFGVFKCRPEHTSKQKIFSQEQADNTKCLIVRSESIFSLHCCSRDPAPFIHYTENMVKHEEK